VKIREIRGEKLLTGESSRYKRESQVLFMKKVCLNKITYLAQVLVGSELPPTRVLNQLRKLSFSALNLVSSQI
jgi:hypothetical protein